MNTKDYELVASATARLSNPSARAAAARSLATALAEKDPNFKRALFLKACQIEEK